MNLVLGLERHGRIEAAEAALLTDPVTAYLGGGLLDSFGYVVEDGQGATAAARVDVTIRLE